MHGPPLTIDEVATMLAREVAALRQYGARLGVAIEVVAKRNDLPGSHRASAARATEMGREARETRNEAVA